MARELHHRNKDNKYALWSSVVDDYVTKWLSKEEIRNFWYQEKIAKAMEDEELEEVFGFINAVEDKIQQIDNKDLYNYVIDCITENVYCDLENYKEYIEE